jgi:hypothetical protein
MLSLSMSCEQDLTLSQRLIQECSCCGQDMSKDPMREGPLITYLEGMQGQDLRYHLCPTCFKSVPPSMWDTSYKRKWTIRAKKLIAKGARIDFGFNVHVWTEEMLVAEICKTMGIKLPPPPPTREELDCAAVMEQLKAEKNWQI